MFSRFIKIIICLLPVFNLPGLVSCRRVPDDSSPKINWSDYVIITPAAGLPQEDSGFGKKTNLLNEVKTAIEEVSGYYPEHFSGNAPEHEHEILLGFTTRQESQVLREELRERDFIVAYRNGSFIVCGGSDEALVSAVRVFIREIRNGLRGTEDREIVKHTGQYPQLIQVMINGTDVKEFRFSHVMECVYPASSYFCSSFCSEYGYNPDRNATIAYEANVPLITGDRAHFIVFGYGKGFYDGAPEAEDGTAVILSNGNSIMIYSGGDGTDKFKKLHAVLLKIIAETPTEDGKKSVNIPYGVTVVNMK